MSKVNELLKQVEIQAGIADERRSNAIESGGYATTIEYWRGQQDAWLDAAVLIRHYLGGGEDEGKVQS